MDNIKAGEKCYALLNNTEIQNTFPTPSKRRSHGRFYSNPEPDPLLDILKSQKKIVMPKEPDLLEEEEESSEVQPEAQTRRRSTRGERSKRSSKKGNTSRRSSGKETAGKVPVAPGGTAARSLREDPPKQKQKQQRTQQVMPTTASIAPAPAAAASAGGAAAVAAEEEEEDEVPQAKKKVSPYFEQWKELVLLKVNVLYLQTRFEEAMSCIDSASATAPDENHLYVFLFFFHQTHVVCFF